MQLKNQKIIGVLALQGSFAEHISMLAQLKVKAVPVRSLADTKNLDGLIIPGGESTTMMDLLKTTGLDQWLIKSVKTGLPIYGTCAGMIVLANLGLIDITVARNAYGPQLYSFEDNIELNLFPVSSQRPRQRSRCGGGRGGGFLFPGVFIRAPRVTKTNRNVRVLAHHGKDPALMEQANVLASSFHPELTKNQHIHRYFLNKV